MAARLVASLTALQAATPAAPAGESNATLGVSLQIVAGCAVSNGPGTAILIACTNQVPYQLGVTRYAAAALGEVPPVDMTVASGPGDVIDVVVTY